MHIFTQVLSFHSAARKGLSMDDPISFHPALFSQTVPAGNEAEEFSSSDQEENPNQNGNTQVFLK